MWRISKSDAKIKGFWIFVLFIDNWVFLAFFIIINIRVGISMNFALFSQIPDGKNWINDMAFMQHKHHSKTHHHPLSIVFRARKDCRIPERLYKALGLLSEIKKITMFVKKI